VSATSASVVWAVGGSERSGLKALILHWDGTSWMRVTTPPAGRYSTLFSVSASSATQGWAVGNYGRTGRTWTLHWDGTTWNSVSIPNIPGSGDNALLSVWTRTSKDAFAVGSCFDLGEQGCGGHFFATIFMHWNGAQRLLQ
jgi:hypothetical protein